MFHRYYAYYNGKIIGMVSALTEQSALVKAGQIAGVGASAYTGKASRLVEVKRY